MSTGRLIPALQTIIARAPRPYSEPYRRLEDSLERAQAAALAGSPPDEFPAGWRTLVTELLFSPSNLEAYFPRLCEANPVLTEVIRGLARPTTDAERRQDIEEARRMWLANQADLDEPSALIPTLLHELTISPFLGSDQEFLGRYYRFLDALNRNLVDTAWRPLHRRVFELLDMQKANWTGGYVGGYAYQGYGRIGISGLKPTEPRLAAYQVDEYLVPDARILDIGSNCGFLSLEIARSVNHVTAIEYNPYLVLIGREVGDALGVHNVDFICGDFTNYPIGDGFDVVLSFATHHTIDAHMAMPWADYVAKLHSTLRPGGILLFESHNVFDKGIGEPGDDGDLNAKFDIAERSFEVIRHKMTRAFVPIGCDVDKLFVVMRRRDEVDEAAVRTLDLYSARESYEYEPPA
jgi:SAM-dependent methyltransferase